MKAGEEEGENKGMDPAEYLLINRYHNVANLELITLVSCKSWDDLLHECLAIVAAK